ncbi:MAG: flagellar biosynthesis protein FlgN [Treponemataceae bacterium]|nr:flagellar biosynthesis protein FlgN [Treponemataceae bacterium]
MEAVSEQELNERVAVLRRLRSLLEMQRRKFREYLDILEKQESSIDNEDVAAISAYADLEQDVVSGIANLQKAIVPMAELCGRAVELPSAAGEKSVAEIQQDLARLQGEVLARNERNRELLRIHLVKIRGQLEQFQNPYNGRRNVYASAASTGALVEVEA